jgi:hypothetical protein
MLFPKAILNAILKAEWEADAPLSYQAQRISCVKEAAWTSELGRDSLPHSAVPPRYDNRSSNLRPSS